MAIDQKEIKGQKPGPSSQELLKRRQDAVARGPYNLTPVFAKEARGAVITDVDDNRYIDMAGGIGILNVGHNHPKVVRAIQEQMEAFIHTCFHVMPYEPYVELSEKLNQAAPGDHAKKTMFANSGAEAIENAVKIARKYTKRPAVISFETGYHGRTLLTMSLTSKVRPYKHGFGPFAPETYKTPYAYCYRCPFGSSYPGCGLACVEKLEQKFISEVAADEVAAVLVEPVQGEGGFIVPPKDFLPALQKVCNRNGIMLIVDEVQSGFGRTGRLFASEHSGVIPDLITLSKSIAAGIPLSAVVGRAEVMDAPDNGEIGGTFGGSPLGCKAGLAVLNIIESENLLERANQIGQKMVAFLKEVQEKHPLIGDIRHLGAMVGIELVKDPVTKEPAKESAAEIVKYCWQHGVIVLSAGIFGNVLRFLPPLVIKDEELDLALQVLAEAIRMVSNKLRN